MIRASGLSKSYFPQGGRGPEIPVLREVDLEIPAGQFTALVGPSGSGKTTLLSLLAGLDSATRGKVEIDGHDITRLTEEELARFRGRNLGFIFQSYYLIPSLSALENVATPLRLRGETRATDRARELLEQVGLSDRMTHYPRQLSGGESQRVAIARALIAKPKVIFADEPTGNLDSANGRKVMDLLTSLRGSTTIILVTHDSNLAEQAERRIFLKDGRVTG